MSSGRPGTPVTATSDRPHFGGVGAGQRPSESVRITEACTACGACLATCPEHALRRAPKHPRVIDAACTACWACVEICPAGAILEAR